MKRILLTSTAIVAFAGAAAADVSFSGDAEVGFNDEFNKGVYWSMGLTLNASAELDNGLTASLTADIGTQGDISTYTHTGLDAGDIVGKLSSDTASLTFGDTAPAADVMWSGVTNMDYDDFNDEADFGEDGVMIGQMTLGGVDLGVSYSFDDANSASTADSSDDFGQLQLGVAGTAGSLSYTLAYQDDAIGASSSMYGASVGMTLGGADVLVAYASGDNAGSSLGVQATYPVGDDMSVKVFYVMEDPDTGTNDDNYGIELSYAAGALSVDALFHGGGDEDMQINFGYDMGNGLNVFGGYRDEGVNDYQVTYIGADYDLGGGASARLSYASVDGTGATADELGKSEDVHEGATVQLNFAF